MSTTKTEKKHVLVISSSPLVLAEIKKSLISAFEISIAATSAAALAVLEKYETAAIIVNVGETRETTFPIFYEITENERSKTIPVLFLADEGNEDDETEAFSAGAVDYSVRRPGAADALISRINLRIRASENEKQLQSEDQMCPPIAVDPEMKLYGKTILVVDDVELNRDLIDGMLSSIRGLTTDFAVNGEEAIDKYTLAPDRYALILMDVQMPVLDGIDATKIIRGLNFENARKIPIIALTAGVEEEEIESYLKAGMNDFLKKPMEYEKLLNIVSKCVM